MFDLGSKRSRTKSNMLTSYWTLATSKYPKFKRRKLKRIRWVELLYSLFSTRNSFNMYRTCKWTTGIARFGRWSARKLFGNPNTMLSGVWKCAPICQRFKVFSARSEWRNVHSTELGINSTRCRRKANTGRLHDLVIIAVNPLESQFF